MKAERADAELARSLQEQIRVEAEEVAGAPAETAEAMAPVAAGCDEELARRLQEQEEQALEESRRQQQAEDARLAQALEFVELEPTGT